MLQWKQRLYAFLLRRALAPFLAQDGLLQLHECIDVSIQEGMFALQNINLNLDKIADKLKGFQVLKAQVSRLEIVLKLLEHGAQDEPDAGNDDGKPRSSNSNSSSFAWRALQFTSTPSGSKVSLMAQVTVSGLVLELSPCDFREFGDDSVRPSAESSDTETSEGSASVSSVLASYIDAAMASLRLSLELENVQLRLCDGPGETKTWLEVRLQAASYRTADHHRGTHRPENLSKLLLSKVVNFARISLFVGCDDSIDDKSGMSTVAMLDGTSSRIAIRVFEGAGESPNHGVPRIQQDIQIDLNQRLSVSVDATSLRQIHSVILGLQSRSHLADRPSSTESSSKMNANRPALEAPENDSSQVDHMDLRTIDGIMKEYYKARLLAEQNHFRGGILLPAEEDDTKGGNDEAITFDAFFDANDQSIANVSTILRQSIMECDVNDGVLWFVHTKVRLNLSEGCVKAVFGSSGTSSRRRADEYLLLSFSELALASSLSLEAMEHTLHVSRIDVEDSQRMCSDPTPGKAVTTRVDIGTVLRFAPTYGDDDPSSHSAVVLAPPCIAVSVKVSKQVTEIDVALESFDLTYRHRTVANVLEIIQSLVPAVDVNQSSGSARADEDGSSPRRLSVTVTCPAVTLAAPLSQDKNWNQLYVRRGYSVNDTWLVKSSLAMCFHGLVLESSGKDEEPTCSVGFQIATIYAISPSGTGVLDRSARRFDLLCLSGRSEVDPAIDVVLKLWTTEVANCGGSQMRESNSMRLFPSVPAISSFKARQEDDDDDDDHDKIRNTDREKESIITTDDGSVHFGKSLSASDFDDFSRRKHLAISDPQPEMMKAVASCQSVVEVHIPEFLVDITCDELFIILDMFSCIASETDAEAGRGRQPQTSYPSLCISLSCDEILVELRELTAVEAAHSSLVAHCKKVQTNLLLHRHSVRQMRVLSHYLSLIEALRNVPDTKIQHTPVWPERTRFRDIFDFQTGDKVSVLLHRSVLFPALSSQNPAILFDMIDHTSETAQSLDPKQRNVYATLYDLNCRVNYGDGCMERLGSSFERLIGRLASPNENPKLQVLRLFLSVVDCNLDYASPSTFVTPSRLIVRIGDLRLSSNVVSPTPVVQAFAGSLGDVALYVAKTKFPYRWEDSQIPLISELHRVQSHDAGDEMTIKNPDSIQKLMGLTTVALLDSLDAKVQVSSANVRVSKSTVSNVLSRDPKLLVKLTIGELGLYAAKDSFAKLLSSITELVVDLTAIGHVAMEDLRSKSYEHLVMEQSDSDEATDASSSARMHVLEDLKRQSALRPTAGTSHSSGEPVDFLLDGYDWTAVDQDESAKLSIPAGEEQVARWYGAVGAQNSPQEDADQNEVTFLPTFSSPDSISSNNSTSMQGPNLISHHFPVHAFLDPLGGNDMDLAKLASTSTAPSIETRVIVQHFSFKIRCFDGFDWPELLDDKSRNALGKGAFVLDQRLDPVDPIGERRGLEKKLKPLEKPYTSQQSRKQELLGELLGPAETPSTFRDVPLPEERGALLREHLALQRLGRRPSKYLQVSGSGISLKLDSLVESRDHRLASCLSVQAHDFFVAETISTNRPIKFAGEWVSDTDHPRDSNDGLIAMKMATWHPYVRVTPHNEIVPEESEAVFTILPLRCTIDQKAIRFAQAFFRSAEAVDDKPDDATMMSAAMRFSVPPPLFRSVRVKAFKLKVHYQPEKVDARAIYNGALVELINLSPLDGMVLTLQPVRVENASGWGEVVRAAVSQWLRDVCATQLHKFLASARPLEPIAAVGGTALDLVVLPWEAVQNGESVQRALRTGAAAFSSAVVTESLTLTSRAAQLVADHAARWSSLSSSGASLGALPHRPADAPRDLWDAAPHAAESLARGLRTANYRIAVVPYREYRRRGATGAVTSVLRGIPVAVAAPTGGAAEALSFAALGARNQVRPDLRREEDAALRGLHWEG